MLIKLEDDKLDRGKELEKLFNLFNRFGNQNGHGITMLINGKYGSGKTTILNFIEEKALKENSSFNVIRLNIWEEKLFDNPLFSLLSKISELETNKKSASKEKGSARLKEFGWQVLNRFTRLDMKAIWRAGNTSNQEINCLDEYKEYNNAVEEYKKALAEYCNGNKTILLIDELDRCLPEYQIKTLEILHHFFDVPNLIVVIAMDKSQLEHSIKNIFGESLDIIGYLNKFFNYEVQLPIGSIEKYVLSLLGKINFSKEYKQDTFIHYITNIFIDLNLKLRDMQRVVDEIALIYNEKLSTNEIHVFKDAFFSQDGMTYLDPVLIALLVILKNYKRAFYNKYFINQHRSVVSNRPIDLLTPDASIFRQFLDDIQKNIFKNAITDIIESMTDKYFLLNLINLLCPISDIDSKSIENYLATLRNQNVNSFGLPLEFELMDLSNYLNRNGNKVRSAIIDRINLI